MAKINLNVKVSVDLDELDLEYDSISRAIEQEIMRELRAQIAEAWKAEAKAAVKKDQEIRALIEKVKRNVTAKMKAATE